MGFFDLFRKRDEAKLELDPLQDLVLAKLRVGFLVDYDLKTWQVTAHHLYDFNDGEKAEEWELTAGRQKRYLELVREDGESWTLSKKVPFGVLGEKVRQYILEHDDPPQQVSYQGTTFYYDAAAAGYLVPGGQEPRQALIKWEFLDEDEERFLTIEQWGETEFEAAVGESVEEYQFTTILPGDIS